MITDIAAVPLISGQLRLSLQSALILPSASLSNRNCETNGKLQLCSPCETASYPRFLLCNNMFPR